MRAVCGEAHLGGFREEGGGLIHCEYHTWKLYLGSCRRVAKVDERFAIFDFMATSFPFFLLHIWSISCVNTHSSVMCQFNRSLHIFDIFSDLDSVIGP